MHWTLACRTTLPSRLAPPLFVVNVGLCLVACWGLCACSAPHSGWPSESVRTEQYSGADQANDLDEATERGIGAPPLLQKSDDTELEILPEEPITESLHDDGFYRAEPGVFQKSEDGKGEELTTNDELTEEPLADEWR